MGKRVVKAFMLKGHPDDVDHLLIASRAAKAAGRKLKQSWHKEKSILDEADRDIKLELDFHTEAIILEVLKEAFPYPILTEETGLIKGEETAYRWIVDPLDGSMNFLRGIPLCCTSVALYHNVSPILGVVYDFLRDDLYSGFIGKGAWINDTPLHVSSVAEKAKAVLCTGFPVGTDFSKDAIGEFTRSIREFKKVRLLGTAALSLAFVASGMADAYFERDIKIWDVAAGRALVEAAGGRSFWSPQNRSTVGTLYAGNGLLPPP
jgi:myo-inositol-1(or 4)-monophosphatase